MIRYWVSLLFWSLVLGSFAKMTDFVQKLIDRRVKQKIWFEGYKCGCSSVVLLSGGGRNFHTSVPKCF